MELSVLQSGNCAKKSIAVGAHATVKDLLQRVAVATGCPVRTIRLFYCGRELRPEAAKLSAFNVGKNGSNVVHMTTKVIEINTAEEDPPPPVRPVTMRSQSSSSTLIDLTDTIPVTMDNWTPRSSTWNATPRSDDHGPVDLTGSGPSAPAPPTLLTGRGSKLLAGGRDIPAVKECPHLVAVRLRRLDSQRLYLLDEVDSSTTGSIGRRYIILGSNGASFNVTLDKRPTCTCKEAEGSEAVLPCKHLVFILVKVLKLHVASPLLYQRGFLQSELKELFDMPGSHTDADASSNRKNNSSSCSRSSSNNNSSNSANNRNGGSVLSGALFNHIRGAAVVHEVGDAEEQTAAAVAVSPVPDPAPVADEVPECPICFEELPDDAQNVSNAVVNCAVCNGAVHDDCIKKWIKRSKTCPCCRSMWKTPRVAKKRKQAPAPAVLRPAARARR